MDDCPEAGNNSRGSFGCALSFLMSAAETPFIIGSTLRQICSGRHIILCCIRPSSHPHGDGIVMAGQGGIYWTDVLVNISGFVPVGFFLLNYLSLIQQSKRPAATVLLLGFFLSLTIEILQWFLPTRDSDMTDLICNTFWHSYRS